MLRLLPKRPSIVECGGGRVRTVNPIVIIFLNVKPLRSDVTIPAGFESDLASVPRLLWPVFPKMGESLYPAIVHDYFYMTGSIDKKDADDVFLALMESYGVKKWRRELMYRAVKWFGFVAWRGYRKGET